MLKNQIQKDQIGFVRIKSDAPSERIFQDYVSLLFSSRLMISAAFRYVTPGIQIRQFFDIAIAIAIAVFENPILLLHIAIASNILQQFLSQKIFLKVVKI